MKIIWKPQALEEETRHKRAGYDESDVPPIGSGAPMVVTTWRGYFVLKAAGISST